MRAPWLADVLRAAGLDVSEVSGWQGRGRDMSTIYGVVCHETVSPPSWSDAQNVRLIRDGHASLSGPLYQVGVNRQGKVYVIAAGRCNHNGHGFWSNDSIGVGVFANGAGSPRERWTDAQEQAVIEASRAIIARIDLPPSERFNPRVAGHKETDPGRKQDPWNVDMDAVRRAVASPSDPQPEQEDIVASLDELRDVVRQELYDRVRPRQNETVRLAQAACEGTVALHRQTLGLAPDPESDRVWSERIRTGDADITDAVKALRDTAAG